MARLADHYGAETNMPHLLELLSAECKLRGTSRVSIYERCGAYFPDLGGTRSSDAPAPARPNCGR